MAEGAPVAIDTELLRGFRFACRPDCGLCCYAEPRVEAAERDALIQLLPETEFRTSGKDAFLAARPDGGACQFLDGQRCRAHAVRPHPCREYPLTVHVGRRLQATVVLSCPGVDLELLLRPEPPGGWPPPVGLSEEFEAVRSRLGAGTARRLADAARRGRRVERALSEQGRWQTDDEVRRALAHDLPVPGRAEFPVEDPPAKDDGLAQLPLFFDERAGPVAIASGLGGWELVELAPVGGSHPIDLVVPPEQPPSVTPEAERMLEGYLRYWLRRDAFLASVQFEMLDATDGRVSEWAAARLRELGALTLSRAVVRAKLSGRDGTRLTSPEVAAGIRAVDQDALDRPTWGDRF